MNVFHGKKSNSSENGIALAMVMLVLLLVSTVIAGMIVMATSETTITANFRDEQTAFFASRAGLEEVRDRLRPTAPNAVTAPTALPGTANGILYVTNPLSGETVAPWNTAGTNYPDDEICKEVTCSGGIPSGSPWYTSASYSASYAASPQLVWKWLRVMPKVNKSDTGAVRVTSVDGLTNGNRICWNGTNEVSIANTFASCPAANANYKQVYELTALAVTSSGSRRMTQYEVTPAVFPVLPGAMIFDGASPTYSAPNSNAFGVSGNDAAQGPNAGAGCGAANNEPAVGGFDASSVTALTGDIPRPGKYTGTGGSPSVSNVNGQLGALATVDGLQKLVATVTSAAVTANIYNGNASSLTNPGTDAAPVINVVTGDLSVGGGFSGAGILLVEGTLTMSGNPSYNGVILVIGKGVLVKNGGGNGTLNGSLLVANMNNSSGTPIALGANNPPGAPTINWNGGGNATIQYDSCWINTVTAGAFPLKLVSMRELIY
jgi:Tfp pilus assembly protein PilX